VLVVTIVIAVVPLLVSAMLSATETAIMLLPLGRVHRLVESRTSGSEALNDLLEARSRLRAVAVLMSGFAFSAGALLGAVLGSDSVVQLLRLADQGAEIAAAFTRMGAFVGALLGITLTHSLTQALPRTLAVANSERIGLETARFALPVVRAIYPLTRLLGAPWRWAAELVSGEPILTAWAVHPDWRGTSTTEGEEREEAEEALLEAVSDFAEKVAREVMVPRTDVTALPDSATAGEAIDMIESSGFSRLPVYRESIDDILGVLYAKDLLVAFGRGAADSGTHIAHIARAPFFVPETKPVQELLLEMRTRTHIAIVADEYGGTAGIVTLEDLLEEIVGEISDEFDREEPLVVDLGEGRYRVDARLPVDDLNEVFGTGLDTEADSVGGLYTEVAGRIPETGEALVIEGLRFTVTEREGTRILQLTVEPSGQRSEGDDRA
jgi:CBS domain containing-hemolysin-like protein